MGFGVALREILGKGSLFGMSFVQDGATTLGVMGLPPGAFITLGILMAVMNMVAARQKRELVRGTAMTLFTILLSAIW